MQNDERISRGSERLDYVMIKNKMTRNWKSRKLIHGGQPTCSYGWSPRLYQQWSTTAGEIIVISALRRFSLFSTVRRAQYFHWRQPGISNMLKYARSTNLYLLCVHRITSVLNRGACALVSPPHFQGSWWWKSLWVSSCAACDCYLFRVTLQQQVSASVLSVQCWSFFFLSFNTTPPSPKRCAAESVSSIKTPISQRPVHEGRRNL